MLEYLKTNIFFTFAILFFIILPVILTFSLGYSFNPVSGKIDSTLNLSIESQPLFSKISINNQIISEFGKVDTNLEKNNFFTASIEKNNFIQENYKLISPTSQNANVKIGPVTLLPSNFRQKLSIEIDSFLVDNHIISFDSNNKQLYYKNILQSDQLGPAVLIEIENKIENLESKLKLEKLNSTCYYDKSNNIVLNYRDLSKSFGVNFNSNQITNKPKKLFCHNNSIIFINQFNQLWSYSNNTKQFTFLEDEVKQLFISENDTVWIIKSDNIFQVEINTENKITLTKIYQNLNLIESIEEFQVLNFIQGYIIKINNKVIQAFPNKLFYTIADNIKIMAVTNRGVALHNQNNQLIIWNLFNKQQKIIELPQVSESNIINLSYSDDLKRLFIHSIDSKDDYSINSIWINYEQLNPLIIEYSNVKWVEGQKNCNKELVAKIQYCQNNTSISAWNTENLI